MEVSMERVAYRGWNDCVRLANGQAELVITAEVGPRVVHYGLTGGPNVFGVMDETAGQTGGDEWHLYGGHRLWHSPEIKPRTYSPDNEPVQVEVLGQNHVLMAQAIEMDTRVGKAIEVELSDSGTNVRVVHYLTNHNPWSIELAPWALTVMAKGGEAVVPVPRMADDDLLPSWRMTLWPYTNLADPRIRWGDDYIRIRQDPTLARRCKIGLSALDGWVCYVLNELMFLKRFVTDDDLEYPDWGASVELFTNEEILEVETLGPLTVLEPGETIDHVEEWSLVAGVVLDDSEASITGNVLPNVML
jgi:hypothetical protein